MSLDYGLLDHFFFWVGRDSLSVRCFMTAIRPLGAAGARGGEDQTNIYYGDLLSKENDRVSTERQWDED
jgi:hypothetical protein